MLDTLEYYRILVICKLILRILIFQILTKDQNKVVYWFRETEINDNITVLDLIIA